MGRVLITDAGGRNVVSAIRSLGKKGVRVVGGEAARLALGFFSKYCHERLVYPSPHKEPDRWYDWLMAELTRREYDLVMPISDACVEVVSRHREEISRHTRVTVPDFKTLMRARDKAETLKLAISTGVPHPQTRFITDLSQVGRVADEMEFPVVVKPRLSSGSRGIVYVRKRGELEESYQRIHSDYPYPMIQEYIPPGGRALGVFGLFNAQSEVRAVFGHRRLREFPLSGGPSTLRESVYDPELIDVSTRFLKAMSWFGVAMVEYKEDPRDGKFKIMEVNPRFWGSLPLAIAAGVDFPYMLYSMVMNGDIEPLLTFPEGVRCRWLLPGDILHFLANPNRFRLDPSFFDFSKDNRHDDFISWEDPGPTLGFFVVALRDLFALERWKHVFARG